jgi:hypothetical protein
MGLADIARRVEGRQSTTETRYHMRVDGVAGDI